MTENAEDRLDKAVVPFVQVMCKRYTRVRLSLFFFNKNVLHKNAKYIIYYTNMDF